MVASANRHEAKPSTGEHLLVVSHRPKPDNWHPEADVLFFTGVAAAVEEAKKRAGDRVVAVCAGNVGGQALALDLVDEVAMDVVPVVFGKGKRYFGPVGALHMLEDPSVVIRVTGFSTCAIGSAAELIHLRRVRLTAACRPKVTRVPGKAIARRSCCAPNGAVTGMRGVVLVEGNSDRVALYALAERSGRDLAAEGIEVVAMGGITNTRAMASRYGPHGLGLALAGLYDAADEAKLQHGLVTAGLGAAVEPHGLPGLGFYRCFADLEDELIRAFGVEAVEDVIDAAGETRSLRLLAGMPTQRDWTREAVLRRFLAVRSGRKARYAALLVEALEPSQVPEPLAAVLARA